MSEFSDYLLLRAPIDPHEELVRLSATGLVLPSRGGWSVVVSPERETFVQGGLPLVLLVDYAAEHGLEVRVYVRGKLSARLSVSSAQGRKSKFAQDEWVDLRVLDRPAAARLDAKLRTMTWTHAEIRDELAAVLGVDLPRHVGGRDLAPLRADLADTFPEGDYFVDGRRKPWGGVVSPPGATANSMSIALLERVMAEADAEAATPRPKKGAGKAPKISAREGKELADAVRSAPSVEATAPALTSGDVDLAACATPRAWLDAKRTIDPARASAGVIAELERTVRAGRFLDAGDSAVVVREGAAMLLGRSLAAQRGASAGAWLQAQSEAARSPAERAAWDCAISALTTALKPKPRGK